jgi:hypothetical protein
MPRRFLETLLTYLHTRLRSPPAERSPYVDIRSPQPDLLDLLHRLRALLEDIGLKRVQTPSEASIHERPCEDTVQASVKNERDEERGSGQTIYVYTHTYMTKHDDENDNDDTRRQRSIGTPRMTNGMPHISWIVWHRHAHSQYIQNDKDPDCR